jgi:CRISPR-associated protein Cas2
LKYLVCFDIQNDKKRRIIGEWLEEFGIRVQRSVFEIEISKAKLNSLIEKINKEIDKKEDSIRFYYIHNGSLDKCEWIGFGGEPFWGKDVYCF